MMQSRTKSIFHFFTRITLLFSLLGSALTSATPAYAASNQFDINGPAGSGEFGYNVTTLPNGNFVVADPYFDAAGPIVDVGAVYLYNGATHALISTLTGSQANDSVGGSSLIALSNGNFIVVSSNWNAGRGAATFVNGTTGLTGTVSSSNSLVGATPGDNVGGNYVYILQNNNYIVFSSSWNTGFGAATFGSGTTGISGLVSSSNSLVGSQAGDQVGGYGITELPTGNYVVRSPLWANGAQTNAGAATWGSGTSGVQGVVSALNSLVGSTVNDYVGGTIEDLPNGNYVVASSSWNNGGTANVGAVTWGNGTTGLVGVVSAANSLIGSQVNDYVGGTIKDLYNGNYVVGSYEWDNGGTANVGAATWGNGATGLVGVVTAANSLIGSQANDKVGYSIRSLTNGNYVVGSYEWDNGGTANVGAATWGNGATGLVGVVTAANSLIGSQINDYVGYSIKRLTNGNYVVGSENWDNGAVVDAGSATWGNGAGGTVGVVSAANSLVGSQTDDYVGEYVRALENGNYVLGNYDWDNGAVVDAGAATWGNGAGGTVGVVSAANSLVGSQTEDYVGEYVVDLYNGNYVLSNYEWDNGAIVDAGAVTWGNGAGGTVGVVSAANSLVGSQAGDRVGDSVYELYNGNYVVTSYYWDNGAIVDAGAVTWGNGVGGTVGVVSAANSLVGSQTNDYVGYYGITELTDLTGWDSYSAPKLSKENATAQPRQAGQDDEAPRHRKLNAAAIPNGDYVVWSPNWDNGATVDSGAVTLSRAGSPAVGTITSVNSVRGTVVSGGNSMDASYDSVNSQLVVSRPADNIVTLMRVAPAFADVPVAYWAFNYVERLYNAGVTGGCSTNPLNYCPDSSVTRAQMAVFLLKSVHGASYTPPAVGGSTGFTDVALDYWAAAWIKQLAVEGITGGCGVGVYCPDATVTRAQMAVFLLKGEHGSGYNPPAVGGSTGFGDVATDYWAAAWIKQLAAEGVTSGCGVGIYCPDADVTRAQMAIFLVKAFNLP